MKVADCIAVGIPAKETAVKAQLSRLTWKIRGTNKRETLITSVEGVGIDGRNVNIAQLSRLTWKIRVTDKRETLITNAEGVGIDARDVNSIKTSIKIKDFVLVCALTDFINGIEDKTVPTFTSR